jgi:hypothetical protein
MTNPLDSLASEWSSLKNKAANKDLKVDPNVAYDCAKLCVNALNDLLGLRGSLEWLQVDPSWFGTLPGRSGQRLAGAFDQRRLEMDPILGKHAQIVTDMGNTFINAGTSYIDTDAQSAANFGSPSVYFSDIAGSLSAPKPTAMHPPTPDKNTAPAANWVPPTAYATPGGYTYGPSDTNYPVAVYTEPSPNQTTSLPGPNANSNEPTSFGLLPSFADKNKTTSGLWNAIPPKFTDTSASLQWGDFQTLGNTINWPAVYDVADRWMWFNRQLNTISNTLYNGIVADINSDTWTGKGAAAANTAISDYYSENARLMMAQYYLSDNMTYATTWLTYTKGYMPTDPMPKGSTGIARLNQIRQFYDNWYKTGYNDSAGNIPMMPLPGPVTSGNKSSSAAAGGPGGSSGGSTSGGSTNGASPTSGNATSGSKPAVGSGAPNTNPTSGSPLGGGSTKAGPGANAGSPLPTGGNANAAATGLPAAAQTAPEQQSALQGLAQAMQLGQEALQAGLQAAQQVMQNVPGPRAQPSPFTGLEAKAGGAVPTSGKAGLGGGPSGLGGGPDPKAMAKQDPLARLFPRASLPATPGAGAAAPTAAGSTPFLPGAGGAPGLGHGQGQEKERRRAKYLESGEHLEEAMGGAPMTFKPVVGEKKSKADEYAQGMEVYGPRVDRLMGGPAQGLPPASVAFHEPDSGRRDVSVREESHSGTTVPEPGQFP